MTTFDNRDKGFENKFAHEEELTFKATALCNRMIGMWAAERMGKNESEAERYAHSIIEAEFANGGHVALEAKLVNDLLAESVVPFWRNDEGKQYFDECIRDEKQARRAYRYTLTQAVRHGIVRD